MTARGSLTVAPESQLGSVVAQSDGMSCSCAAGIRAPVAAADGACEVFRLRCPHRAIERSGRCARMQLRASVPGRSRLLANVGANVRELLLPTSTSRGAL